jgi:type I restriction enzyme S subunit
MGGSVMQASWIDPSDLLLGRLDGEFYAPEFVRHERLVASKRSDPRLGLRSLGLLGKLITGPFGSKLPSNLYQSDGVPLFRVQNVQPFFADESSLVYIAPEIHRELRSSEMKSGGVLISKAGRVGDACIAPAHFDRINITEHVIGLTTNQDVDPYYITAALNADFAGVQLKRFGLGTILQYLGVADTRSVEVPVPGPNLQSAIGNKLRKAERLREKASAGQSRAIEQLDSWYGGIDWNGYEPFGWMAVSCFEGSRLDAWFYQPSYRKMEETLRLRSGLVQVAAIASPAVEVVDYSKCPDSHFQYFEIADVEAESGTISSKNIAVNEAPSRAKYRVTAEDVLVSTVRPNRKGIALVPAGTSFAVCSSGFAVLRCSSSEIAHYLRASLAHDVATHQLMRWNTGATYPAIDRDVPLFVMIPWPSEDAVRAVGRQLQQSAVDYLASQRLVDEARSHLEAMIDGTLDADALVAEGKEIDRWLDQSPKSTTKGNS